MEFLFIYFLSDHKSTLASWSWWEPAICFSPAEQTDLAQHLVLKVGSLNFFLGSSSICSEPKTATIDVTVYVENTSDAPGQWNRIYILCSWEFFKASVSSFSFFASKRINVSKDEEDKFK